MGVVYRDLDTSKPLRGSVLREFVDHLEDLSTAERSGDESFGTGNVPMFGALIAAIANRKRALSQEDIAGLLTVHKVEMHHRDAVLRGVADKFGSISGTRDRSFQSPVESDIERDRLLVHEIFEEYLAFATGQTDVVFKEIMQPVDALRSGVEQQLEIRRHMIEGGVQKGDERKLGPVGYVAGINFTHRDVVEDLAAKYLEAREQYKSAFEHRSNNYAQLYRVDAALETLDLAVTLKKGLAVHDRVEIEAARDRVLATVEGSTKSVTSEAAIGLSLDQSVGAGFTV